MYASKLKAKTIDELFEAVLSLKTIEDCYRFFEDIAMRLQVAKQLHDEVNYSEIIKST